MTETGTRVRVATRATYAAFIGSGFAMSSWATRIPQVRDGLGLTPSRLGLVLLAIAAGSIVSLVLAGQIVSRFGSRRTVAASCTASSGWSSDCSSSASRTAPGTWR